MKKYILFAVAALVGLASCQKEAGVASGDFPDGGEYEIVFEELEGDGTKAAITEVYLDTKGDLAAKSQTLTARLQNKTTKAKISADSYTWSVNCTAVEENVDQTFNEKNTLTAKTKGTGKVSVSATYKGQSVTSSDVPVTVTESEIESIRLLGSDIGCNVSSSGSSLTSSYKDDSGLFPPISKEGSSNVSLLCLYDSGIESWGSRSTFNSEGREFYNGDYYSNGNEVFLKIQPVLCLYVEVSYKGIDKKKKVNVSDGVEYTFLDQGASSSTGVTVTYENYVPLKLAGYSSLADYSHYDVYRMQFPSATGTANGYYSKYFGDHQVKAVYKGFESTLDFKIAFDQSSFDGLNKLCDFNAWCTETFGVRIHDWWDEQPNGSCWYDQGEGIVFEHEYDTWGICYRWHSPVFHYSVRYFNHYLNSATGNYEFLAGARTVKFGEVASEGGNYVYVETAQQGDDKNRFDVWFLNKCIYSVYCGPQTVAWEGHEFTGGWGDCPEYF